MMMHYTISMNTEKNLVLGAGASGISFGLISTNQTIIIESEGIAGGHAKSTEVGKWVFDRGPHIIFSKDKLALDCIKESLGENILDCVRKNRVSIGNKIVNYPIENGLNELNKVIRYQILISFLHQKITNFRKVNNLEEWFIKHFGRKLTEMYFKPYNEKVWKVSLKDLSLDWTERIPFPKKSDFIFGLLFKKSSEGYLHQLFYNYPKYGGYQAIMNAWVQKLKPNALNLKEEVRKINLTEKYPIVLTNKQSYSGYRVISTIPLKKLDKICDQIPHEISQLISELIVNPMYVVTLGFEGEDKNNYTAIYFPEKDYLVNRISFPHVFSKFTVPENHFMIQAEITLKAGESKLKMSESEIVSHVIEGLKNKGIIENSVAVFAQLDFYDDAYVVYSRNHKKRIEEIKKFFESKNLYLHGRFGGHEYLNIDGCLRSSIELHRKIDDKTLDDDEILKTFSI